MEVQKEKNQYTEMWLHLEVCTRINMQVAKIIEMDN